LTEQTTITPSQRATLRAIADKITALKLEAETRIGLAFSVSVRQDSAERRQLQAVHDFGCYLRFASIFGRSPTASESAAHSRSVRKLREAGLVTTHGIDGCRPTFVDLTPAGWKLFKQLQESAA
jgi:hypothetical protein